MIFKLYLEIGSVGKLRLELARLDQRSKCRTTKKGDVIGDEPFTRGALYHLLTNRHYVGLVRHKDQFYQGLHPPVIDRDLFDAVQQRLKDQTVTRRDKPTRAAKARLTGRVFLEDGTRLVPSFAYGRGGQPYAYYIDPGPVRSGTKDLPRRLSAEALETFVQETLARLIGAPDADWSSLDPLLIRVVAYEADTAIELDAGQLVGSEHADNQLSQMRGRLLAGEDLQKDARVSSRIRLSIPHRLSFRGGRTWLSDRDGDGTIAAKPRLNVTLIAGLKDAHAILSDEGIDPQARQFRNDAKSPVHPYQRKLCLLALLAPDIQRAIIEGRTARTVTLHDLIAGREPPLLWSAQAEWFSKPAHETLKNAR